MKKLIQQLEYWQTASAFANSSLWIGETNDLHSAKKVDLQFVDFETVRESTIKNIERLIEEEKAKPKTIYN